MATKTHVYPRVDITTKAINHSSVAPGAEDTTVLFVPLCTKKGPSGVVTPIHSLSEFINTFGSLDYNINGQTALNVYNWLSNGGTIYTWRLSSSNAKCATAKLSMLKCTALNAAATEETYINITNLYVSASGNLEENKKYLKYHSKTDSYELYTASEGDVATENTYIELATSLTKDKKYLKYDSVTKYLTLYTATEDVKTVNGSYVDISSKYETVFLNEANTYYAIQDTKLKAKYDGSYYNNMEVTLTKTTDTTFNISISCVDSVKTVVEKYSSMSLSNYKKALTASNYIDASNAEVDKLFNAMTKYDSVIITFNSGSDAYTDTTQEELLKTFWGVENSASAGEVYKVSYNNTSPSKTPCIEALGNSLETPIDLIMDAGYSEAVKLGMMTFINNSDDYANIAQRPDIIGIFDDYTFTNYLNNPSEVTSYDDKSQHPESFATNIAIYHDYYTINDATFTDRNIYVGLSYFLSKLIPYNDLQYGIQSPTAGLRRAVLDDVLAIHSNPSPDDKDDLFEKRLNYVEKSSRECAIMSQRTHDGSTAAEYTALSFLNNARALEKMKKEIERLARNYLFEFNDSATLSQMSSVLNKYMNQWVSNRTLSEATVVVSKNAYSDEAVDVTMNVRFNGTIEVISVDITIA